MKLSKDTRPNGVTDKESAQLIAEALPWIKNITGKTIVIKYGGAAISFRATVTQWLHVPEASLQNDHRKKSLSNLSFPFVSHFVPFGLSHFLLLPLHLSHLGLLPDVGYTLRS